MNPEALKKLILPLGIFFIISSTLIFEISLVRIFSVTLYRVNSFLAISSALFGLAFGGVIVYLFPGYFNQEKFKKILAHHSIIYPLTMLLLVGFLVSFEFVAENLTLTDAIIIFAITTLPFVVANIILSLILKVESKNISNLYFFDLLGAGTGVLASVVLMNHFSAINVLLISASIGLLATAMFNLHNKNKLTASLLLAVGFFSLSVYNQNNTFLEIKSLYNKFATKNINVTLSKWNSFSHVILDREVQHTLPSLPQDLGLTLPERWGIRIDGGAYTEINQFSGDLNSLNYLKQDLSSLGFQLVEPGQALVIGPGGGRDVLMGLLGGHKVTAVEINPIIINDIMLGQAQEFSGNLYRRPDVTPIVSEGRSFINQDQASYQVISLPLVDTWASTTGGNLALVENNLYTVEAFEQYLSHLTTGGILTISRWDYDGAKLVTLFLEASKNLGLQNPEKNIVIAKMNNLNNYLFKTAPFTESEIEKIKSFSQSNYYSMVYLPNEKLDGDYTQYLNSDDKQKFIESYPTNIKLADDNQPFFFFTIPSLKSLFDPSYKYQDGGLVVTTLTILMFTVFLIVFPVVAKITETKQSSNFKKYLPSVIYFMSLGLSFIFIEIALIQKFILYLEKPIYSYSVVLATMLIAAGVGSWLSQKINPSKTNLIKIVGLIFILVLLNTKPLKTLVIDNTISLPIAYKIILTVVATGPISMLMGMLLPLGIKKIDAAGLNQIIPWVWSLNGAASVLGSILAVIIAIFYGFNAVLLTGGVIYLLAVSWLNLGQAEPDARG